MIRAFSEVEVLHGPDPAFGGIRDWDVALICAVWRLHSHVFSAYVSILESIWPDHQVHHAPSLEVRSPVEPNLYLEALPGFYVS